MMVHSAQRESGEICVTEHQVTWPLYCVTQLMILTAFLLTDA